MRRAGASGGDLQFPIVDFEMALGLSELEDD
jgi:hypothetical protein